MSAADTSRWLELLTVIEIELDSYINQYARTRRISPSEAARARHLVRERHEINQLLATELDREEEYRHG